MRDNAKWAAGPSQLTRVCRLLSCVNGVSSLLHSAFQNHTSPFCLWRRGQPPVPRLHSANGVRLLLHLAFPATGAHWLPKEGTTPSLTSPMSNSQQPCQFLGNTCAVPGNLCSIMEATRISWSLFSSPLFMLCRPIVSF